MSLIELAPVYQATALLMRALELVFPQLLYLRDPVSGSYGGYLSLRSHTGEVVFVMGIGEVVPEKAREYFRLSLDESARLFLHPEHDSSRQSRDGSSEQCGIAIKTVAGFLSFAGLETEEQNEVRVLAVGHKSGLLGLPDARAISDISGNRRLFEQVFRHLHLDY